MGACTGVWGGSPGSFFGTFPLFCRGRGWFFPAFLGCARPFTFWLLGGMNNIRQRGFDTFRVGPWDSRGEEIATTPEPRTPPCIPEDFRIHHSFYRNGYHMRENIALVGPPWPACFPTADGRGATSGLTLSSFFIEGIRRSLTAPF